MQMPEKAGSGGNYLLKFVCNWTWLSALPEQTALSNADALLPAVRGGRRLSNRV